MTVLHDCLGCRTFELPPSAAVGDVKARIDAEAGFPRAQQRLWHRGREVRGAAGGAERPHPAGRAARCVCVLKCGSLVGSKEVFWTSR